MLSVFTREWLDTRRRGRRRRGSRASAHYDGREIDRRDGPVRRARVRRRAHAPRVVEAARRRVRAARAAVRDDRGRRRPARDRERARHRRRPLAARRDGGAPARRLLHGVVVRARVAVRVAAPRADDRRPRCAPAPAPRDRPRRDDELPRRDRRRADASSRSSRSPSTSTATRPASSARSLQAYAAAGIRSDHEAYTAEEGRERLRAGHVAADPRGLGGAQPRRRCCRCSPSTARTRIAFCTDDREPEHIADDGHINSMVRDAVAFGIPPEDALVCATLNPSLWHRLDAPRRDRARAPADLLAPARPRALRPGDAC